MPPTNAAFDYQFDPARVRQLCITLLGVPEPYSLSLCVNRAVRVFRNCLDCLTKIHMYEHYIFWCHALCPRECRRYGAPRGYRSWEDFAEDQGSWLAEQIWGEVELEA